MAVASGRRVNEVWKLGLKFDGTATSESSCSPHSPSGGTPQPRSGQTPPLFHIFTGNRQLFLDSPLPHLPHRPGRDHGSGADENADRDPTVIPDLDRLGDQIKHLPPKITTAAPAMRHDLHSTNRSERRARDGHSHAPSTKYRMKSRLREMMVTGQRLAQTLIRHDHKGNAIGQRPVLVRTFVIEIQSPLEKPGVCFQQQNRRVVLQFRDERPDRLSCEGTRKCIGDF